MEELTKHEYSNLFEKSTSDLAAVKESIALSGYDKNQPIVLFEGRILDGYHRYTACKELGIKAPTREFTGTTEQALGYVWSMNFSRRHLSQRAKVMSMIIRNDWLPKDKRLTKTEIAAKAGKESRVFVDQLMRLNDINPTMAGRVARGEKSAQPAIKEVLQELPGGTRQTRQLLLNVTSKALKDGFWAAQERQLMSDAQATTKAVTLFIEWAKAQSRS